MPIRACALAMVAGAASFGVAVAQDAAVPTPASLTQALSCQSRDAVGTFGELLFLQDRPPHWMHPSALPKALDGMIGVYGYAVEGRVSVFGEPVDHVYFMNDWVVALLPRATAERIIHAEQMARAPIAVTEQYYRFVDPAVRPMIGSFAPTGDAMAKMMIDAFGGGRAPPPTERAPPPRADMLLVGCNYTVASQADFLAAARSAEDIVRKAGADLRGMVEADEPRPGR